MNEKQEKKSRFLSLCNLYNSFILQKSTLIILIITLILFGVGLYYFSNPSFLIEDYLKSKNDFHQSYFSQGLFIIQILNSIIIVSLCYNFSIKSINFDVLFLSFNSRKKITLAKIITSAFIMLMFLLLEMIIMLLIPLIIYPSFKLSIDLLLTFLYLYIIMLFEFFLSLLFTTIVNTIFTPMAILFVEITIKILFNNVTAIKDNLKDFIPYISYNKVDNIFTLNSPLIVCLWVVLVMLLYIQVYSMKDIKEK